VAEGAGASWARQLHASRTIDAIVPLCPARFDMWNGAR